MTSPRVGIAIGRTTASDGRLVDAVPHQYARATAAAGGLPLLLPPLAPSLAPAVVGAVDALLLTGGVDVGPAHYGADPGPETAVTDDERDVSELAMVKAALARQLPVLAICRGAQLLNVALGGTLHQHLAHHSSLGHDDFDRRAETVHSVSTLPESLLRQVVGCACLAVNSVHHQGLDRLGDGLEASAWAEDALVEAAEDPRRRLLAVQWHPELIMAQPGSPELFQWLVSQAANPREL